MKALKKGSASYIKNIRVKGITLVSFFYSLRLRNNM